MDIHERYFLRERRRDETDEIIQWKQINPQYEINISIWWWLMAGNYGWLDNADYLEMEMDRYFKGTRVFFGGDLGLWVISATELPLKKLCLKSTLSETAKASETILFKGTSVILKSLFKHFWSHKFYPTFGPPFLVVVVARVVVARVVVVMTAGVVVTAAVVVGARVVPPKKSLN